MIDEDVVPRHRWRLGIVVELIKSTDELVRGAKVKVNKTRNVIQRPVNCLYPIEVRATEQLYHNMRNVRKRKKKDVGNNNSTNATLKKKCYSCRRATATIKWHWCRPMTGQRWGVWNLWWRNIFIIKIRVAFVVLKRYLLLFYDTVLPWLKRRKTCF